MEILEGKKYRNYNTEKSIMDIKVDDNYTIYVFKGNKSKNDIIIKYSKCGKTMRQPKHIHWVIDILLKEQKNHNEVIGFIKCMRKLWDKILGLQSNDFITLKDTLIKYKNKIDKQISILTLEGGEYPVNFVLILMILLMLQEKTNRPDAYLFKRILDELLKDNIDIYSIVSTSTFRGR